MTQDASNTHGRVKPPSAWRGMAIGIGVLACVLAACLLSLPWTLGRDESGTPRYASGATSAARLPPWWVGADGGRAARLNEQVPRSEIERLAQVNAMTPSEVIRTTDGRIGSELKEHWPEYWLGTDSLGRSVLVRCLAGGGLSLLVGIAAAVMSVVIGTLYGAVAAYAGGSVDAVMMRIVDVLYGLPYVLLVVLLAVAGDAVISEYVSRHKARTAWSAEQISLRRADGAVGTDTAGPATVAEIERKALELFPPRDVSASTRTLLDLMTLLVAIGGVSWLTMARVIRGQVLSLKARPFVESARAIGASPGRIFVVHLLPNLVGPIAVYAALTVPQAILQESFLSFLGIGVKPPLPSWGNMAADGLGGINPLNPSNSEWWMLASPCVLLAVTLAALNFVGEGLRAMVEPVRR